MKKKEKEWRYNRGWVIKGKDWREYRRRYDRRRERWKMLRKERW